jgi:hypothetical protein
MARGCTLLPFKPSGACSGRIHIAVIATTEDRTSVGQILRFVSPRFCAGPLLEDGDRCPGNRAKAHKGYMLEPFTGSAYLALDHHLMDLPGRIPHSILHVRKERGGDALLREVRDYAADADVYSLFLEAEDLARAIHVEP